MLLNVGRRITQSEASQGYITRRLFMFIKLGSYIFSSEEIRYVAKFPSGCNVYLKNTKEAVYVTGINDEEYSEFTRKLCCEPEVITFNQPKFTKEFEEEVMSMKLCNRKTCEGCEHIQTIENPIDVTEPHIFICKMMNKELLDDMDTLPTPYRFYKSEYHYKEEE